LGWKFIRIRKCPNCKKIIHTKVLSKEFLYKPTFTLFGAFSYYRYNLHCKNCNKKWSISEKEDGGAII